MVNYIPEQGDIVYIKFSGTIGHEQFGNRPALVISNKVFNDFMKMAIVCPFTNNNKNYPYHFPISDKYKTKGVVMLEQLKTIDYNAREIRFIERIDDNDIKIFSSTIKTFMDIVEFDKF